MLLHVRVSNSFWSCHNNILHLRAPWEFIDLFLINEVHPMFPNVIGRIIKIVVDHSSVELTWKNLPAEFLNALNFSCANRFEPLIERSTVLCCNCNAQGPDSAEHERAIDDRQDEFLICLAYLFHNTRCIKSDKKRFPNLK